MHKCLFYFCFQLRSALDRIDELESSNSHLSKRVEKMKANRSAMLAQQWCLSKLHCQTWKQLFVISVAFAHFNAFITHYGPYDMLIHQTVLISDNMSCRSVVSRGSMLKSLWYIISVKITDVLCEEAARLVRHVLYMSPGHSYWRFTFNYSVAFTV